LTWKEKARISVHKTTRIERKNKNLTKIKKKQTIDFHKTQKLKEKKLTKINKKQTTNFPPHLDYTLYQYG